MSEMKRQARRVLVIDDNPDIHKDFRKILQPQSDALDLAQVEADLFGEAMSGGRRSEFVVEAASQGQEGLEKLEQALREGRPFEMAFVDMRMPPGWDGIETIRHLWQADPQLQVVICTAYSDHSWNEIVEQLGHSEQLLILKKPFEHMEVLQLALALTEKYRLAAQARMKMEELEQLVEQRTALLRQRDEQLRQKQRLEAVGSLAGGVAHEFNNLLQAIQGYVTFARDELPAGSPAREDVSQALACCKRAATIVSQLLNFSRQREPKREPLELNRAIQDTLRMLKPLIGEHIRVETQLSEPSAVVVADENMLGQVLLNLCINARDAMPDGGTLRVATRTVQLGDRRGCTDPKRPNLPPGEYAVLEVQDSGCGMVPEVRERIFEPFFTTKEVGKGSGLGLATVYGIVTQHEGEIQVESEPGQGTTFRIFLPLSRQPAAGRGDAEQPLAAGHERILVAEDESAVRDVLVRILSKAGYQTLEAQNGREAVQLFHQHGDQIDLVLLDAVMPEMTGREAWEAIRQLRPDTPCVLCTGYDPATAHLDQLNDDQLPVVAKPVQRDELLRVVREQLDARQKLSEPVGAA